MGLILTVRSKNPQLSYILQKNPETIKAEGKPFRRDLRQGFVYGWFMNEEASAWRMVFLDSPVESSFSRGNRSEFEYLDKTRYSNPYLPILMIDRAIGTAAKSQDEKDVEMEPDSSSVEFTVAGNSRVAERTHKAFAKSGVIVDCEEFYPGLFNWTVKASTVNMALNVSQTICLMLALRDPDADIKLNKEGAEKYLRIFNRCDAPYFLRYMFSSRALHNDHMFEELKPLLDTDRIKLTYGDTRVQRFRAIREFFTGGERLIDIGCGDMYQAMKLGGKYKEVFAVDADEDIFEGNTAKIKSRNLEGFKAIQAEVNADWIYLHGQDIAGADVLMTEVLEHMEKDVATCVLSALANSNDYNKVFITLPNKDFNVHYGMADDEDRHDDHKWEPTFKEVEDLISGLNLPLDREVKVFPIGDTVDGVSVSIGVSFSTKVPVEMTYTVTVVEPTAAEV